MYYEIYPLTKTITYWARDFHEYMSNRVEDNEAWMKEIGMVIDNGDGNGVARYFHDEQATLFVLKFGAENVVKPK